MAFAISISFTAGRFHATPWGHHVNEGVPEWPPSPWRLQRALVAVWKQKLSNNALINEHMPSALNKLEAPPVFKLPRASLGHTRHFMPWWKNWKPEAPRDARTLVFDAFVALRPDDEVVMAWPDVNLTWDEEQSMCLVLANLGYFGRAESWCKARVCVDDWLCLPGTICNCLDIETGEIPGDCSAGNMEPVRVLCLDIDNENPRMRWNEWAYGQRIAAPDPAWNLLAGTDDVHKERWSDPPGSCWLTYLRPVDAFATRPARRSPIRQAQEQPTVVRFALDGPVLPLLTETVYVAEIARRYIQGVFGNQNNGASSPVFSGKSKTGQRLDNNHQHAFYLPTDEDGDGKLDHLTIFCKAGLGDREQKALDTFRQMHGPGGTKLGLLLLGAGKLHSAPLLSEATTWRSVTPFVPTRHHKRRGSKRDTAQPDALPEVSLCEEVVRRGLPVPTKVTRVSRCTLPGVDQSLSWLEFRRQRVFGAGKHGTHPGAGFEIEFPEPVSGPLALGYGCHFGLGLFAPA